MHISVSIESEAVTRQVDTRSRARPPTLKAAGQVVQLTTALQQPKQKSVEGFPDSLIHRVRGGWWEVGASWNVLEWMQLGWTVWGRGVENFEKNHAAP